MISAAMDGDGEINRDSRPCWVAYANLVYHDLKAPINFYFGART